MFKLLISEKNLRSLIFGRISINLGDSLFYISLMWIIYDMTKNSMYTAIAGFLFSLPEVLSFLAGPFIDRGNKKKMLIICCLIEFLILVFLFFIESLNATNVWVLLLVITILSMVSEFSYPIESAMLPTILKKEDLVKGNALMSLTNTGIDLSFNAIAGVLLAILSYGTIFISNSLVFLLALFFFSKLKFNRKIEVEEESISEYFQDLKEGINFVKHRLVRKLLMPLIIINLFYAMLMVNLPHFADKIVGSSIAYGLILTLMGIGSIVGAAFSDVIGKKLKFGWILNLSFTLSGITWIIMVFMININIIVSGILLILSSALVGFINVLYSTLFQQLPEENMIARVNTVNLSLVSLCMPIGSLLGGLISNWTNVSFVIYLYGIGFTLLGLLLLFTSSIRELPYIDSINQDLLNDNHY